jgi:hypothetical protein
VYADGRNRQVELYDPQTATWRLGPPQQEDRAYHSTALLLPDGRVFSAGDDLHPRETDGSVSRTDTAEIYSPPYLFKGPRPTIDAAPDVLHWGEAFGVGSASPGLSYAVLVAPGATTHAADMHQRIVGLQLTAAMPGAGLSVVAPPSAAVAPPGYYMLFLLNDAGVPSVARWVRLGAGAPGQPTAPAPGVNQPGAADSTCSDLHQRVRKAKSKRAKRRLRRKLRSLGC